jgi:hypothetical protein
MGSKLLQLISGGQTGADRAALDFAIDHQIPHGGWCPAGRLAEDGPIPLRYQLTETPSASSSQRTEWNVRDSDGTVVFSVGTALKGGSLETVVFARKHHKPVLHLSQAPGSDPAELQLTRFLRDHQIKRLNVAGPRASEEPAVAAFVRDVLESALTALA